MDVVFDANKSLKNDLERKLPFTLASGFDFSTAVTKQDDRRNYTEDRYVSLGYLNNRLHVICFTPIATGIRVISLRVANKREGKIYDQRKNKPD